jgi:deoxycytidine triphosphate deaminase
MLLSAKQILEKGIIIPSPYSKAAQVGIDLSLAKVEKITGGSVVYKDTTIVNPDFFINIETTKIDGKDCWVLEPGTYAISFNEGCNIPENYTGLILHRSSLYRTGTQIVSPVWDPGYHTETMGTVMIVHVKLIVERDARVCQILFHENSAVDELYDGQFQGGTTAWAKAQ